MADNAIKTLVSNSAAAHTWLIPPAPTAAPQPIPVRLGSAHLAAPEPIARELGELLLRLRAATHDAVPRGSTGVFSPTAPTLPTTLYLTRQIQPDYLFIAY